MTKKEFLVPDHVRGLIFDCDGTLVDSMPLHMLAREHSVTAQGWRWDYSYFNSKKGMPDKTIIELYNEQFGFSLDFRRTTKLKDDYFHSRADQLKPIEPVVDVALRYRNILAMAVASGSTRANVEFQLNAIGVFQYFNVIVTADDGIRPKPSPDIFVEAARRLGVAPNVCQVFEDADLGLEAARSAGMLATDVR
jgi:haloacid dehalogenase superfamily, subfamily IA, variant 3 with third motif having DD or ED